MFGDEPYGNYNRILLSSVLAGTHDPKDIFINPLAWYDENGSSCTRAREWRGSTARRARCTAADGVVEPYDRLVIATGSVPFVPPLGGPRRRGRRLEAGSVRLPHPRRLRRRSRPTRRGARTAAVIGGGLLGLEAARGLLSQGLEVHVVHLMPHLMEVQLDPAAGVDPGAGPSAAWASTSTSRRRTTGRPRRRARHRPRVQGRLARSTATWS